MREQGRKNGPNDLISQQRPLDCFNGQRIYKAANKGLTCPTCGKMGLKNVKLHQTKAKCGNSSHLINPDTEENKSNLLSEQNPIVCNPVCNHSVTTTKDKKFHHITKPKDSAQRNCLNLNVKEYIFFPKPTDKELWQELDDQLYDELPVIIADAPAYVQIEFMEEHIYKIALRKFGPKSQTKSKSQPKTSHHLKKLRNLKKKVKLEYKNALKNGNIEDSNKLKHDFHKVMRLHNKVRKLELDKREKTSQILAQKVFQKNPHRYAQHLFNDDEKRLPTFQKKNAEKYFATTYQDKKRDHKYHPLKGLKRPRKPDIPFDMKTPSLAELKQYLNRRRNSCSPGTNRIPHLLWKKCPKTTELLYQVLCKVWKSHTIPISWRVGETILISKNENTSDPANFRPITLKNSSGNLFMGLLAQRIINFLVRNKFIDTSIQKGFMEKIAGCLEHTEALTQMLQNAKKNKMPIVTTWLDLQNAYGSVPHNLIQHALEWYYVPESIRKMVFNYYDESYIRIKANDWITDWIHCGIGVFQGCPLSCILFLAVFNLCLDFLKSKSHLGYQIKDTSLTASVKAYADDLTLITKNQNDNQLLIDMVEKFLSWSRTMKAKPSKCFSHAMARQLNPGKCYTPYDPKLKINGENIKYIQSQPMKFLGKLIYKDLNDDEIRCKAKTKLIDLLEKTNKCPLNGIMKAWIYNNAIVPRMTWEFTVYNFPITFIQGMEAICTKYLKRWIGVCRSITTSALYRSRNKFGLQLKRLTTVIKCMQLTKYHLNKYSKDTDIKSLYEECIIKKSKTSRWNGIKELEERERHLVINEICRGQDNRHGLGYKKRHKIINNMHPKEHRQALSNLVKEINEDDMLVYLMSCAKQGQFLKWDTAMQVDTSWKKLLYVWSPELLSFHVNAIHDLLPSPANLKLWGKINVGTCQLCNHNNCTLFHILNGCSYSLQNGRYNWRHDQTLKTITSGILPTIDAANKVADSEIKANNYVKTIPFKSTGGNTYKHPDLVMTKDTKTDILHHSNDWIILMDEEYQQITFPPQITETAKRPDITIYSEKTKTVIIIELTVPSEENLANANYRKKCKYEGLCGECENRGWHTFYFPIEIGSRGFYSSSASSCLKTLGIPSSQRKSTLEAASKVALRASYYIWLNRTNKLFQRVQLSGQAVIPEEERWLGTHKTSLIRQSLVHSPETLKSTDPGIEKEKTVPPCAGLLNLGNTCYMNSTIQALGFVCKFRYDLLKILEKINVSGNNNALKTRHILPQLCQLIKKMWSNKLTEVNPSTFNNAVKSSLPLFNNSEQHDSHEFFCILLDHLQNEMKSILKDEDTVQKTFKGLLLSEVKCLSCRSKSETIEPFTTLSLDIPKQDETDDTRSKHQCTILDMLNEYTRREKLYGTVYSCQQCNHMVEDGQTYFSEAEKQLTLMSLPKCIVIHVQRVQQRNCTSKVQTHINFENKLNLSPYCSSKDGHHIYYLSAVIAHQGKSFESGHYTAYCYDNITDIWYHYNDANVYKCTLQEVQSCQAFLLFYSTN